MKNIYYEDPETLPPIDFQDENYFEIAMSRVNTSKMTPLEIALYENSIMRDKVVADHNKKAFDKAKKKGIEGIQKYLKTESVKKALFMGVFSIEHIAEVLEVPIKFVKQVEKSLW